MFQESGRGVEKGGHFPTVDNSFKHKSNSLLEAIREDLVVKGKFEEKQDHYQRLVSVNREIESHLARRYSLEQYREWLSEADFEILQGEPKYFDAVQVMHARKI